MPDSLTRRAALGGVAVVALGSCGGGDPPPSGKPEAGSGAGLLNSIVARELAAVAAWAEIGRALGGDARDQARTIRERERDHVGRVSALVRELGGTPPEGRAESEYQAQFPRLEGPADALRFATDLEQQLVRAYLDALRSLPQAGQRRVAAEIAVEEAQDLAVAHLLAGEPAAGAAFVTGTS